MLYSPIVTILEVNTVSLRLIAFKRSDVFFRSIVTLKADYAGVENNRFIKPDQLFNTIQNMFVELSSKIKYLPSIVYVILPQSFIRTNVADSDIAITGKQVKALDVANLCKKCMCDNINYTVIDYTPITFKSLNYPIMFNPIGQSCDKLYGKISCVSLENRIKEFFDACSKKLKKSFTYIGESNVVIDKLDRDLNIPSGIRLVINIRDEHISINLCKGKAIIASKSIEWGANHIYYALQDLLKIKLDIAKMLVPKLNLNINCVDSDTYVLNDGENMIEYNMKVINSRIIETLVYISENIKKAVVSFNIEGSLPVYITGNDICMVRGVKEIMNNAIGGEMIDILLPNHTNYDTANDYIIVAELEKLLNITNSTILGSFIAKLGRI